MKLSRQHVFILAMFASTGLAACEDKTSAPSPVAAPTTPTTVETTTPAPSPTSAAPQASPSPETTPDATPTPTETAATAPAEEVNLLASLPAPYNDADYDQGRRQFAKCRSCHLIEEGAGHRVGPNLHGVFSRNIAELEDFKYSKAAQEAEFEWTPEKLDQWLANPKKFLPGNRMTFAGIAKEEQRLNLIAYLMVETSE